MTIAAGAALLLVGAEMLVRGGVGAASRLGVSPLLIGLTIVGFGTSTPELVTSLQAVYLNAPAIAIGNVVGANIVNILVVLGLTALIAPIAVARGGFTRDAIALLVSAAALIYFAARGGITHQVGLIFLVALGVYLVIAYLTERRRQSDAALKSTGLPLGASFLLVLLGLAGTVYGARLFVEGAIAYARSAGLSESFIGLTIVAGGTSLPELTTSVIAMLRRQSGIAFGNVVGANIHNVLLTLGVTGLVHPIEVPGDIAHFDLWVMLAVTLFLVVFAWTGRRLSRLEGLVFILGYAVYIGVLYTHSSGAT